MNGKNGEGSQKLQSHLFKRYKRYKYIIENVKDVIWEMNMDFVFTFVSPNSKVMLGYEPEELVGRNMLDFLEEGSRNHIIDLAIQQVNKRVGGDTEETVLIAVQFICKNGLKKWVEVSANPMFNGDRFIGYIGTTRDITEKKEYERQLNKCINKLKTLNAKLEKMATVDTLTGAYNRRKFNDDLNLVIKKKEECNTSFSLIFFDIDHFKTINDRFGHKIGDYTLQCISKLVKENIRKADDLFRWGGEEFIIILYEANWESAKKVAGDIRNIIQNHDFGFGQKVTISLSVGEYEPNENIDQTIIRLDKALLKAKHRGRNRVVSC